MLSMYRMSCLLRQSEGLGEGCYYTVDSILLWGVGYGKWKLNFLSLHIDISLIIGNILNFKKFFKKAHGLHIGVRRWCCEDDLPKIPLSETFA